MKWGILATGTIAKKFASTVEQMGAEGEQLVAVGSRHMESAQAFAQQYGIPRCYDSYEALAADPEVEAIYVATPNTLHYENCKLCLEQGKHVLCEKPFTISPEQAQQLYRLAEEKHLFLMEAFWIWLLPLYDRLREILTAGTIGELKQITCQYGFVASVLLAEGEPKTSDAIRNFERLHSLPVHICTDGSVLETQSFAAVVDALYGTGFHGELRPSGLAACGLIRRLHKSGAFVLSLIHI